MPTNLPLMKADFFNPFIKGVAPPSLRNRFVVKYPDHEFNLSKHKRRVLVTHGHYLDRKQTLFKNLKKYIRSESGNTKQAVRKFFIATAQYQAVANAVSYMKGSREFVDLMHKTFSGIGDSVRDFTSDFAGIFSSELRHKPIDSEMLRAIEMYLVYFSESRPDVFIFGHTHEAGRSSTKSMWGWDRKRLIGKEIEVWNDGGFIEDKGDNMAGTFIVTDDRPAPEGSIKLYEVSLRGNVTEKIFLKYQNAP